jgi:hypothetical protein
LVQMTRVQKFQLSKSYGLGCRRGTNFCPRTVATAEAGVLTPGVFWANLISCILEIQKF